MVFPTTESRDTRETFHESSSNQKCSVMESKLDQESLSPSHTAQQQRNPSTLTICKALVIVPFMVLMTFNILRAVNLRLSPNPFPSTVRGGQQGSPEEFGNRPANAVEVKAISHNTVKVERKRAVDPIGFTSPTKATSSTTTTTAATSSNSFTSTTTTIYQPSSTSSIPSVTSTTDGVPADTTATSKQVASTTEQSGSRSTKLEIHITQTLADGGPTIITSTRWVEVSASGPTSSSKADLQNNGLSWQPNVHASMLCCILACFVLMS